MTQNASKSDPNYFKSSNQRGKSDFQEIVIRQRHSVV